MATSRAQTLQLENHPQQPKKVITLKYDGRQPVPDSLRVYLRSEWLKGQEGQSILGEKQWLDSHLVFSPLIAFRPDLAYVATYPGCKPFFFRLEPPSSQPTTRVTAIFPSTDSLPANVLKFYLHFSAAMSIGRAYDFIQLLDESGQAVESPFLELQPELWDSAQQRLTLWLDPGRIKRELQPNQQLGPPLEPGKTYTLYISKEWHDSRGVQLGGSFEKKFVVVQPDRLALTPSEWQLVIPSPKSQNCLIIRTPESLDHATALASPSLLLKSQKVSGYWQLLPNEKGWSFCPVNQWKEGTYEAHFAKSLEDLAGNRLDRLFDHPIANPSPSSEPKDESYFLQFKLEN